MCANIGARAVDKTHMDSSLGTEKSECIHGAEHEAFRPAPAIGKDVHADQRNQHDLQKHAGKGHGHCDSGRSSGA